MHGGAGALHRPLALVAGTSMAAGSLAGAVGSRYVGGRVLLAVFGVMGLMALVLMFLPSPAESWGAVGSEVHFDRKAAVVYPAAIGILSGLVGAGGAFLLMPVLVGRDAHPLPGEHRNLARHRRGLGRDRASSGSSSPAKCRSGRPWPSSRAASRAWSSARGSSRRVPDAACYACMLGVLIALATLRVWADVLFPLGSEEIDRALRLRHRPDAVHRLPRLHGGVQGGEPRPARRRSARG